MASWADCEYSYGAFGNPKMCLIDGGRPRQHYIFSFILLFALCFIGAFLGTDYLNPHGSLLKRFVLQAQSNALGLKRIFVQMPHIRSWPTTSVNTIHPADNIRRGVGMHAQTKPWLGLPSKSMPKQSGRLAITSAEFVISAARPDQFLKTPVPHFVFAGRSNVGKSSLLNALVKKKGLAKTSQTPGKTRLVNYFRINNDFYFVDVPGYGYAAVQKEMTVKWGGLIETYLKKTPWIATVFQLMDSRHDPSPLDLQMIEWLNFQGLPYKLILTKTDKLSEPQLKDQIARICEVLNILPDDVIPTSSSTGRGMKELLTYINDELDLKKEELKQLNVDNMLLSQGYGTEDIEDLEESSDEEAPIPVRVAM